MRIKSCLLYSFAVAVVAAVCIVIAFRITARTARDAAVARLETTMTEQGLTLERAPATGPQPTARTNAPNQPGGVQEEFAQLRTRMETCTATVSWTTMRDLFWGDAPPDERTDAQWEELRTFLADKQALIEAIRRIAEANEPLGPTDFSLTRDVSYLRVAHDMARLLTLDAMLANHMENLDRALESIGACMGLANAVALDGVLFSSLTANRIGDETLEAVQEMVVPGTLNREQTVELLHTFERTRGHEAFVSALGREAREWRCIFEGIRDGDLPDPVADSLGVPSLHSRFLGATLLQMDEAACADVMSAALRAAAMPYSEAQSEMDVLANNASSVLPYFRPLTSEVAVTMSHVLAERAVRDAQNDLARMGLLLELHHAETGEYPASLNDIAPDLGGGLPVDPYTGDPYRYIPNGDTFQLYSLGLNARDDGGVQGRREEGDLVWRGREAD